MLRIDSFIHSRSSHMVQNNVLGAQTHYKPTGNIQISFAEDLGVENNIYKVCQEFYSQNAVPPIQLPKGHKNPTARTSWPTAKIGILSFRQYLPIGLCV